VNSQCLIELLPERLPSSFEAIEFSCLDVFFALGIVNPVGPTFSFVATVGDWEEGKVLPVVNVMLNPFSQSTKVVARLTVGASWEIGNDLEPLMHLGFGNCPTLVLLSARIPEVSRLSFTTKIFEAFGKNVVDVQNLVSSHLGDPWTRVSAEMKDARTRALTEEKRGAWASVSAMFKGASRQTESSSKLAEARRKLAQLVLRPDHMWPELRAFLFAWNGSIHETGIPEQMVSEAFSKDRFEKFLLERVCPNVWLPLEPDHQSPTHSDSART